MVDIVGNETLASLWDKLARECGEKDFFIFQGRDGGVETITYRQFNEKINQTANMFLRDGVAFGERDAVQMHTCPEFLMCLFGLAKIGAVTVPMNEQYLKAECEYALDMCEIERAVVEPCYVELYDQICSDGRLPKGISVARTHDQQETRGHRIFSELVDAEDTVLAEQRALTPDDVCEVLFTSGTPATSPSTSEMPMMERNGWIFHFEMARIIRTMAATNARISGKPDMMKPPFESALRTRCCRVPPVDTVYLAARCFMMFYARLSSRISSEISVPHANTAQGRATDLV